MPTHNDPLPEREHLPLGIWALGFVSLLMDVSSELVHSLLPIFLATTLGASMITIGIIEGIAEATAAITKVFSGALSDYLRKRKLVALMGYGLAALTKPIFPLANTITSVFAARFLDRIGKGIRGAPRDALVADITPAHLRGAAYGLRQALDSVGAFLGPLFAVLLMLWFANDIRSVLWLAVIPAFLSVLVLIIGVREPRMQPVPAHHTGLGLRNYTRLPARYWTVILLGIVFTMARFSEAFLILRAQDTGLAISFVPLVMIVMNVVYAVTAYPAGIASDRISRRKILILGMLMLIIADILLALAQHPAMTLMGAALWGLHMGLTQGLLSKLVADNAPADLRGTAFGIFNLITGLALLLASAIAGALWNYVSASATFYCGAAFATLTLLGLFFYRGDHV